MPQGKVLSVRELGGFLEDIVKTAIQPDCDDAMESTIEKTKEQLAAGFNSGVSPDGVPWPALKNPRLPGRNQNNKPLLDSFKLFRSVVDEHAEHIEGISGQGATLGTYVEYAGVHQAGSKDGVIPQRKFLGFSKEIKDYATEEVADSLIRQIDNL